MNSEAIKPLVLIGCGSIFETIRAAWPRLGNPFGDIPQRELHVAALPNTDNIYADVTAQLAGLNAADVRIFVAIDCLALNYARLDAHACVRLQGFKCETLIHPDAIMEPDVKIGENCWIGAGAIIGAGVKIGNNTFIGAGARIDAGVQIANNVWIGPGAALGHNARLGAHCLIGADVKVAAGVVLGRHCVIDVPGGYSESLPDGSFIDPLFTLPVRIFGNAGIPHGRET